MRTLSVVTGAYEPVAEYLLAAYESLRRQEMPDGWEWEWVVQEDGVSGIAEEILPADDRIAFGQGRHGGVAIARNLALARCKSELVKNLDQDDVLCAGVLVRDVVVLAGRSDVDVGWVTSRVLDLLPDGVTVGVETDPPEGRLEPGVVVEHWRTHGYRLPVHPASMCIRRRLAVTLGGWMAVPGSDDTGLLIAASVISAGYFHGEVGLLYRRWPGQGSAQAAHTGATEWTSRMRLIDERARYLSGM
jgi:glycosyltransferase involved in cell wall biosynthesis